MKEEKEPHVHMDEMKLGEGKSKYCGNSMRSRSSVKGIGSFRGDPDKGGIP